MKRSHDHSIDAIFVMTLFGVFAAAALLTLLYGAVIYKDTADAMEERSQERICVSYIASKVRHHDSKDSIFLSKINGVSSLVLAEEENNIIYYNYIYYDTGDSLVKEVFTEKGNDPGSSAGETIVKASSLAFRLLENDLLLVECGGEDGKTARLLLHLSCAGEAGL